MGDVFNTGSGAPAIFLSMQAVQSRRNSSTSVLKLGTDAKLDKIYDRFDELMRRGRFDLCEKTLAEFDPTSCDLDLALGVLTVTLAAKTKLPSRSRFFSALKTRVLQLPDEDPELLKGLE